MKREFLLLIWIAIAAPTACVSQSVALTKVTTGEIATDTGGFAFFAWADFRNSGLLDLVVCDLGPVTGGGGTNLFYRNNGDATFLKVLHQDPAADQDYHVAAAPGDYDNDGNADLIVTAGANSPTPRRLKLYQGNGDGTFIQASGGVVTNQLGYFFSCGWGDYDHDGFLDLIANEGSTGKVLLFHNNRDGSFTRLTTGPLVTAVLNGAPLSFDYDNDGFDDVLVLADPNNALFRNNRDGTFTRILTNSIVSDVSPNGTECATWGDYDNDGWPDLFVTTHAGTPNRLYHNNRDGTFTSISTGPQSGRPPGTDSKACAWGDYDNDGYLDLFVTSYNGPNMLFHNNSDGTFTQVLIGDPVTEDNTGLYCNACSWVDYDNDGFLDLFVTRAPAASNLLYHNSGNTNGWLKVRLVGTVSNRSAIGAKVHVLATIAGRTFWQMREITTGGGRWVQPLLAHFGLGDSTNVNTVRIEWPSGTVQELHDVSPRQILSVTEPARLFASATNGVAQLSIRGGRNLPYDIESSTNLVSWSAISTLTITNLDGAAPIVDLSPAGADRRFYRASSR